MPERVTCIVRGEKHLYSDCRCITDIQVNHTRFYSRETAHERVRAAPGSIVVEEEGMIAPLVAATRDGVKYIRTQPNDTPADALLWVKECA